MIEAGAALLLPIQQAPGVFSFENFLGLSPTTQGQLLASALVLLGVVVLRRTVMTLVRRRVEDPALVYRWGKAMGYVATFVLVVALVQIWFSAIRSLGTFLGLLSAGLAIALKDLVADFAGWLFIIFRRPFDQGDRIQIGGFAGDVLDRRIFQFTIMEIGNWVGADQSTGRLIHVPNARVFTEPLANYTTSFPYLWNELRVLVTFESDWRRAKGLITEIGIRSAEEVVKEASDPRKSTDQRYPIHFRTLTPTVYTSVEDSGVLLTLRYLCRPRERRGTAQAIWEEILDAFASEPRIELAYPTHRLMVDGAPASGAPAAGGSVG